MSDAIISPHPARRAVRGRVLSFTRQPQASDDSASYHFQADGLVYSVDGKILSVGPASELLDMLPADVAVDRYEDCLILPGFIDLHIHLPQTRIIASYGAQLLDWLTLYTFPEEQRFADPAYAAAGARFFLDELTRNGTTTAVVYGSVHAHSVTLLFAEAARRGQCMIAGKVMMDQNAPELLRDDAQSGYDESKALIERWHGRNRQYYAVTPRFAVTSSAAQLAAAGALLRETEGLFLQTHLAETKDEIAAALSLHPAARDYTDLYDRHGLLGPASLFGHCLHLGERELDRLAESRSVAIFCPTSNLFLGSGLFPSARIKSRFIRTGLATDIGGGTSFSMLRTAAEAYKVLQLQGERLTALSAFDRITRGNAESLGMEAAIGQLATGGHADMVVLDSRATSLMAERMAQCQSLEEELFILMTLGDERAVRAVYLNGMLAYSVQPALR